MTEQPGDFREHVLNGDFGHVLGDREKAVGIFDQVLVSKTTPMVG